MNGSFETDQQRILDKIKEAKRIRRGLMANLGESVYQIVRTDPNLRSGHEDIIDGIVACEAAVEHLEDRLAALEARMYAEQAEASLSIVADNVETEPILEDEEEEAPAVGQEPEEEAETASGDEVAEPAGETPYQSFQVTIEPEIEEDPDAVKAAPEEPAVADTDDEDDGFFDEVSDERDVEEEVAVETKEASEAEEAPKTEVETEDAEPETVEKTVEDQDNADAGASFTFTIDAEIEGQEGGAEEIDEFADLDTTDEISKTPAMVDGGEDLETADKAPDIEEVSVAEGVVEGATDPLVCPHCGSPIEGSFKFCIACGKPLE